MTKPTLTLSAAYAVSQPKTQVFPLAPKAAPNCFVMADDGRGPGSPFINWLNPPSTGAYISAKTGTRQPWRGFAGRLVTHEAEVYPHVVTYQNEPCELVFMHRGEERRYTPTQIRYEVSGNAEVIDAKHNLDGYSNPEHRVFLSAVEEHFAVLKGWSFRRVVADEVFSSKVHALNVDDVQMRRFVTIKPEHLELLAELRQGEQKMFAFGDLADRLEPNDPYYGNGVVQALMVHRHLHIDLKVELCDQTVVWLLPEPTPFRTVIGG